MAGQIPELVRRYLDYANIRDMALRTGTLDLENVRFLTPTTLLPLSITLRRSKKTLKLAPPPNPDVESYLHCMMKERGFDALNGSTYLPILGLPKKAEQSLPILKKIYKLAGDPGGKNAFRYLIGELIDNIYQHSRFEIALVMAQQYRKSGVMHY